MPSEYKYVHKDSLANYVENFRNGNKINYKDLVEDIQAFDYQADRSAASGHSMKSGLTDAVAH